MSYLPARRPFVMKTAPAEEATMNLSGIRSTARRMCSASSRPAPRRGRSAQQARAAGELEGEPLVGVLEVHVQQFGDAAAPVGHRVAV
jgi:hypothetical protein